MFWDRSRTTSRYKNFLRVSISRRAWLPGACSLWVLALLTTHGRSWSSDSFKLSLRLLRSLVASIFSEVGTSRTSSAKELRYLLAVVWLEQCSPGLCKGAFIRVLVRWSSFIGSEVYVLGANSLQMVFGVFLAGGGCSSWTSASPFQWPSLGSSRSRTLQLRQPHGGSVKRRGSSLSSGSPKSRNNVVYWDGM